MKKIMWIISIIPLVITSVVLQMMPDSVPMHYNISGEIDRWGSKYENFIFPIIIIAVTLFWQLLISYCEKKSANTAFDKEKVETALNAKILKIVGISTNVVFSIMQCFILYNAYIAAETNATYSHFDLVTVTCILMGVLFIVLGNFIPKSKRNSTVGFRVEWSMYNDITWMKSNRFCAVAFILVGLLTIVTTVFVNSITAVILMLGYLLVAVVITLIYSHKVYSAEVSKSNT